MLDPRLQSTLYKCVQQLEHYSILHHQRLPWALFKTNREPFYNPVHWHANGRSELTFGQGITIIIFTTSSHSIASASLCLPQSPLPTSYQHWSCLSWFSACWPSLVWSLLPHHLRSIDSYLTATNLVYIYSVALLGFKGTYIV